MSSASTIEWTDATWNPVRGCAIVSKGCTDCYAMKQAHRFSGAGQAYEGLTTLTKGGPVWTGKVRTVPELLDAPLHWRKPRRIFVNSMSDLFYGDEADRKRAALGGVPFKPVPEEFIGSVLGIAAACPQHTFQVLTKRPERMLEVLKNLAFLDAYEGSHDMYSHAKAPWPAPNIWLGVSVEDQATADERIPLLLQAPAAVRWVSAEPLLGAIDLARLRVKDDDSGPLKRVNGVVEFDALTGMRITDLGIGYGGHKLDWLVAGGESGPGAREMQKWWARALRDQCAAAGVPFFFKQWGEWAPDPTTRHPHRRVGKKRAGRLLDGREHNEYPA